MRRWLVLIGATAGGAIGWWIGDWLGFASALFLSVLGTAAGVYAARRVARE